MKLNRHCEYQERFEKYLAGTLDPGLAAELETHLSDCKSCRDSLEEHSAEPEIWDNLRSLLGQAMTHSSEGFSDFTHDGVQPPGLSVLDSLAPTDDPEMLGRFGEYEISGVIGIGGMGAVLRGFDKSLRRVVAIKVMASHLAGSGAARERFQREARAAAAVTHDNVIDIYGVSQANGLPFLVMPFARGPSLQKRIDLSGPLTTIEVVRIGRQIAAGLSAAHEQGLVHRDIKPANILLNEGIERLWITDFGVARAMDDVSMTNTGVIAGTPQYMSPEQARGESVDHRSDLFSLGSVLYTVCTGRPPFRSETAYGVLRRITDSDPRPIREINPDIPPWLCRIIDRLMAKHPADRFESAAEVADLLEGCLAHVQQPTLVELPASVMSSETSEAPTRSHAESQRNQSTNRNSSSVRHPGVIAMIALLFCIGTGFVAFELTNPASLQGQWAGEDWREVRLSTTSEAPGWYTGEFTDAQGQRGVLHLEWSRLQRRFNGRWQIGADRSGPITLRVHSDDEARGAVSFDADASSLPNTPRLRDFTWRRSDALPGNRKGSIGSQADAKRTITIETPVKGVIGQVSGTFKVGGKVKKGEILVKIRPPDEAPGKVTLDASRERLEGARELLLAKERELEVAERALHSAKARVENHERSMDVVQRSSQERVLAIERKVAASSEKVKQREAELLTEQKELDAAKQALDKGVLSQIEVAQRKTNVETAKIQLDERAANAEAAKRELAVMNEDAKIRAQQAQTLLDEAIADMNAVEATVAQASTSVIQARLAVQTADRENSAVEAKANEIQQISSQSPCRRHDHDDWIQCPRAERSRRAMSSAQFCQTLWQRTHRKRRLPVHPPRARKRRPAQRMASLRVSAHHRDCPR
jgi:serine/threonine protein kinase